MFSKTPWEGVGAVSIALCENTGFSCGNRNWLLNVQDKIFKNSLFRMLIRRVLDLGCKGLLDY